MKINNSDSINDKILDDNNNNNNRSNSSSSSSSSESENRLINDLLKKHLESEMNSHECDENQESGNGLELARARVEYPGQPDSTHKFYSTRISVGRKPSSPTPNKNRPIRQSSNLQIRNSTFVSREHFVVELVGFYSIHILNKANRF